VIFSGGEPLLEFPLIEAAVEYLQGRSRPGNQIGLGVSTNGILFDENVAEFLAAHDFDTHLSFDGVPQAQNLRAKGTFVILDNLLDRLRTRHAEFFANRLRVNLTLVPDAVACLSDSIRYFLQQGVRELVVYPADVPDAGWTRSLTEELEDQFARVFETCLGYFRQSRHMPLVLFRRTQGDFLHKAGARMMCDALSGRNITVDVDGVAYGCAVAAESYRSACSPLLHSRFQRLRIGSVSDPGFRGLIEKFAAASRPPEAFFRKENKRSSFGRCSDCRFFDVCQVCPLSIGCSTAGSDPDSVPDFVCLFHRTALAYRDRFPEHPTHFDILLAAIDQLPPEGACPAEVLCRF
jgi:sulfatase maturation enzyme AslB (radical SAM superfamily)